MQSLRIFIILFLLGFASYAQESSLTVRFDFTVSRRVFQQKPDACLSFFETSQHKEGSMSLERTDYYRTYPGLTEGRFVSEDVIGKDIPGHSTVTLSNENGTIFLIFDEKIEMNISGSPFVYTNNAKVECILLDDSTWEDVAAGNNVKMKMTKRGVKHLLDMMVARFQASTRNILEVALHGEASTNSFSIENSPDLEMIVTIENGFLRTENNGNFSLEIVFGKND